MKVKLTSHDDRTPQRKIVLNRLPVVMGRSLDADVHLDDCWVSRAHCEISEIDGTLVVRDLKSRNGTLVNGKSIAEARLLPGDRIAVGITRFDVHYCRSAGIQAEA